jgi:exodeoxyribonuclease VII small subunit
VKVDRNNEDALFLNIFSGPNPMAKSAKSDTPQTFESALAELEGIVATMEAGQLPLEQSLASYKRGTELLQFCQRALQDAQQQVRVLEAGALQSLPVSNHPSADDN